MQLALTEEDIVSLAQRTEGWIAGLQLAVLSLQQQTDKHAFVAAFAGDDRYVMDYLLEEVIQRQPADPNVPAKNILPGEAVRTFMPSGYGTDRQPIHFGVFGAIQLIRILSTIDAIGTVIINCSPICSAVVCINYYHHRNKAIWSTAPVPGMSAKD